MFVFVVIAVPVSAVVDLAARRTREAARASADASTLATVAGSVLRGARQLEALLERLRETFGLDSVTLLQRRPDSQVTLNGRRDPTAWQVVATIGGQPIGSGDKVIALDAGADDYVTKPFGVDELLARIRAVTRRAMPTEATPAPVQVGQHTVDLANHVVLANDGSDVRLTPTEWHLLEILLRNPGKLVSQRYLLQSVWGPQYTNQTHYLRQYMAQLRRKLEDDPARPRQLLTEPGMGYRFRLVHDLAGRLAPGHGSRGKQ